jgi:hypothetical protein
VKDDVEKRRAEPVWDPYWAALVLFAGAVACFLLGIALSMYEHWHF